MWTAKLRVSSEKTLIGSIAKRCGIDVSGYPVSFHKKGKKIISFVVGELFGEEKDIKKFVRFGKKNKRVAHLEVRCGFMSAMLKDPLSVKEFYNPNIIYTQPLFISREGYEIYNIAAWDRKELMRFVRFLEKRNNGKLLKIAQEKIKRISIMSPFPDMTDKQKGALDIAVRRGYYEYPRKVDVQDLARDSGVAFSTFQAHLRKAEKKVIDFSEKFR